MPYVYLHTKTTGRMRCNQLITREISQEELSVQVPCGVACESTTYMLESAYNIRGMQSSTRLSLLQEFVSYLRELSPRHSNYATTLDSRDNAKRRRHHRKKRKKGPIPPSLKLASVVKLPPSAASRPAKVSAWLIHSGPDRSGDVIPGEGGYRRWCLCRPRAEAVQTRSRGNLQTDSQKGIRLYTMRLLTSISQFDAVLI
jgi:hypothetical protein